MKCCRIRVRMGVRMPFYVPADMDPALMLRQELNRLVTPLPGNGVSSKLAVDDGRGMARGISLYAEVFPVGPVNKMVATSRNERRNVARRPAHR